MPAPLLAALPLHRYVFRAMASTHELLLADASGARAKRAAAAAIDEVLRIERKYSRYRDDSVIGAINRAAGRDAIAIDGETASLLRYADRCFVLSEGRFDITSGVLRRAWDFRRVTPRVPSRDEIAAACALVGWRRVQWNAHDIRLPTSGMELDFGGIGKEYAADRAATILRDTGIAHGLVNLGGDVRAFGGRDDTVPWRVGIRHPRGEAPLATVELFDGALATSGDYERYFDIDGRRYCHLLDARSGWPVAYWQSVSVVAPLTILAGSYATTAMLAGIAAEGLLAGHGSCALLVAADGSIRRCGRPGIFAETTPRPSPSADRVHANRR
ncbi:MAG TPA: FAD:protein FMN transferase [Casimicrobiaceae bacterium]